MKRKFTLLLTVLFTLFTLPISSLTVLAAEDGSYEDIKDGTYDIKAKAMHETEDKASGAAGFINPDAQIVIDENLIQLIITVPNNDMAEISGIQVEGKEADIKDSGDAKVYTFTLDALKEELKSQVQYEVPMLNMKHDVPFRFVLEGLDELPVIEPVVEKETKTEKIPFETVEEIDSSLEKDETEVKQEGKEGTKEVTYEVTYKNGKETDRQVVDEKIIEDPVNEIILVGEKSSSDNNNSIIKDPDEIKEMFYQSEMAIIRHFNNPIKLIEKEDKQFIQITGNGGQFIDSLMIDGKEAILGDVAEDGTYTMQFEVTKPLSEKLNFKMVIDTGNPNFGKMEHETKMWFTSEENPTEVEVKTESIEYETIEKEDSSLKEGETKVKQKGIKGEKEITYELTYMAGNETDRKVKEELITKKPVNEIILVGTKTSTVKDGTYDITAKAMHANKDEPSGAAEFINEKAQIVIKDGVIHLVITVPHNELAKITGLQVEGKEASIKETKNATIYTFTLETLREVLYSEVQYEVPSMGMVHDVEFRFVLEGLDKLPIKVEELKKEPKEDLKEQPKEKPSDNPKKPKFGSNDTDETGVSVANGEPKNPQTGDTSAIMFYALLLIGSLIPLAVKFKRRFV